MKSTQFLHPRWLIGLLLGCFLIACSGNDLDHSVDEVAELDVVKSPNDRREYRALVLENQMKVLLISDAQTDKAAAAVDVFSGSNSDPEDFEGLAHFLEHMLFLGTQAYPEAGEYQEFISSHGGSHNAYTAYENTNYFFDIEKGHLEPALDRFSQFFIAPLFTPEYVDRERNAVHSEYQSNLQNDGRRSNSAWKAIINQAHPISQFSVGSLDTLRDNESTQLREALLQHYEENYSANLMSLAILGSESLDELEALARQYFSGIENRNVELPHTDETMFAKGQLPAILEIKPVRDSRSLSYTFPIPDVQESYASKPLSYLGNVIGHEGKGSLLSLLKDKGWVNNLSAGGGMSYRDIAEFKISLSLTAEGLDKVDEISSLVFQFIELVKQEGLQSWLFEEQQSMAALSFLFQEPVSPINYVGIMSERLQEYPASEVIAAPYTFENFKPELLATILAELRPDNTLLTFISQSVTTDSVEPMFGGHYSYSKIEANRLTNWQSQNIDARLAITKPNPFLPEDLSLLPYTGPDVSAGVESKPELIIDENGKRLWFKQDNEFQLPKANFYFYAMTPLFNESLKNSMLSSFVVGLVNDKLNEFSYAANLAGVYYGVSRRSRGFSVQVGGYNDKQATLLNELLKTLVEADFEEERFEIIKAEMILSLKNSNLQKPYVRLFQEAQALLVSPYWSEQQEIVIAENITLADVKAFVPEMLNNLKIDALHHGNVGEEDALAMLDIVSTYLESSPEAPSPPFAAVLKLDQAARIIQDINVEHDDSAIVMYMQGADDSLATRAKINLISSIIGSPFYDVLRTEKQLGYVVSASTMSILKTNGLVMVIESPSADPLVLEENIDEFLISYGGEIDDMSQARFDGIKSGVLNNMRQKPQSMSALSGRFWNDILIEEYQEDSTLLMAEAIEKLTKDEVMKFYNEYVVEGSAGRLISRSVGAPHQARFVESQNDISSTMVTVGNLDESYQAFKDDSEFYYFNKAN